MEDAADQEKAKIQADSEKELVRLWRAWRTIHEMCYDRVLNHLDQLEDRR